MNTRERAIKSDKWEWFEGMHTGEALVVTVDDRGQISEVVFDGELMSARTCGSSDESECWYDTRGVQPFFTDATIGCIEHGLLPKVWASAGERIVIDVVADHYRDLAAGVISAGFRCRVLVWTPGSWVQRWTSAVRQDRVEALIDCLEAAP